MIAKYTNPPEHSIEQHLPKNRSVNRIERWSSETVIFILLKFNGVNVKKLIEWEERENSPEK